MNKIVRCLLLLAAFAAGAVAGWCSKGIDADHRQYRERVLRRIMLHEVATEAQHTLERVLAVGDASLTKRYVEGLAAGIEGAMCHHVGIDPDMEYFNKWDCELKRIEAGGTPQDK